MDALDLARIQFAANITFHILFPTITLALGWVLLYFKVRHSGSGDERWMDAYRLWVKIFALSLALGVVSGITMSFQFGTNRPGFMHVVGNIAGPLLAYEVLTAFLLEAAFLGIMLFGFRRVSDRVHTLATFLVAAGTTASAFWILVLNSWMHTPAGYEVIDGVVHATDWLAIVFNPSMPYRLTHMLLASGLTVAFLLAVSWFAAWQMRRQRAPSTRTATLLLGMTFAGWYVTEIGRQPWLVQDLLRTADAAGAVPAGQIGISLSMYLVLYAALLVAYVSTVFRLARAAGERKNVRGFDGAARRRRAAACG